MKKLTLKEKNMRAFVALTHIKFIASTIIKECSDYSSSAISYAKDIINEYDDAIKVI